MRVFFHGAARTVTGSQHLLLVNGNRLLLECGLFQGRRNEFYERNSKFPFDPHKLDAAILSHAHIDHCGNLPNLIKSGFRGPIYTTPASAHLSNIMLMDSGNIQESDAKYLNKKLAKKNLPLVEPLYTFEEAAQVAPYFQSIPYDQEFEPVPGVIVRLVEAGHILGSAAVMMDIEEKGRAIRLWFSGDIGRRGLPLLRDPRLPERADYMIMECTYGDKLHEDPQVAYEELRKAVSRTLGRGGKVIIPAFAVGRTQELVYHFHRMMDGGEIPKVPVYVDSPLAVNATDIFRMHPECFDLETRQFIAQDRHGSALGFDKVVYTRSVEESKALNDRDEPMIIISASGMAEAGRILHHLKNNIENPLNTILIVSWQAPYTLGRRLADREELVKIFGEEYELRAEVVTIGGLSAHAGQTLLLEYAQATRATLRKTFLVHGEQNAAQALQEKLGDLGNSQVYFPELHSSVEI